MAREGIGALHLLLLRRLSDGSTCSADVLKRVANQHSGGTTLMNTLNRMETRGWVRRNPVGWQITERGKRILDPSIAVLPPMAAYRPPADPPRRPGSDYRIYRSRIGDRLFAHKEHV